MATSELVAVAYVNHGRWVAACPFPGCTNAEGAGPGADGAAGGLEPGRFVCRVDYGGCGWTGPVVWPADHALIAQVLAARPVPGTRNWLPGETLTDLVAENLEHEVPVPDDVALRVLDAAEQNGA